MSDFTGGERNELATSHAADVKRIVEYLVFKGMRSKKEICERMAINDHTLDIFLRRSSEAVRQSNTLLKLYRFVIDYVEGVELQQDSEMYKIWLNVVSSQKKLSDSELVFKRFIEYMDSSTKRINRVGNIFSGNFYLYRNSVAEGRLVKTNLVIREDDTLNKLWMFDHKYKDTLGNVSVTSGFIMVTLGNVYCIGRIGLGSGLEVIVFREPISHQSDLVQALILSLDSKQQPIAARAVIKRSTKIEDYGSYPTKEKSDEIINFSRLLANPHAPDRAMTLNLV